MPHVWCHHAVCQDLAMHADQKPSHSRASKGSKPSSGFYRARFKAAATEATRQKDDSVLLQYHFHAIYSAVSLISIIYNHIFLAWFLALSSHTRAHLFCATLIVLLQLNLLLSHFLCTSSLALS